MENEKYYIPDISEIYVGFECEIRSSSNEPFEWEHFKIIGVDDAEISGSRMDWSFYDSRTAINESQIRVKYLSKEDIESCRWEGSKMQSCIDKLFFFKGKFRFFDMSFDYVQLNIEGPIIQIFYLPLNEDGSAKNHLTTYIFQGTIKNKSELIKLMQMLNIK